ncbi:acyltransferase family protein [Agrococcus casei]|uniref:acyltransferase family protein n=1 Tax=Agrococcus casei TaxID=343512 RepID=UPI003F91656C
MRTVAFILVAIYHVWFNRVSGGVDVFFTVSGFLITITLLGHLRRFDTVRPWLFLSRLLGRLLPAAAVVCIAVLIGTVVLRSFALWDDTFEQIVASMLYFENWYLAFNSADYLATDQSRSPLQHFWAMSIQGQFYLIWLAVFLVAVWLASVTGIRAVRVAASLIIAVVILSFAWSLIQTQTNQQFAYFSTATRAWEFGAGSLLALVISRIKLPVAVAAPLSWVGLGALVSIGFLLPVADVFPGWVALIPVLSAAAVVIAGESGARWGANALLSTKPFEWLGGFGYAFYLWHWPVMIFVLSVQDRTVVGVRTGLAILAFSFVLAYATRRLVEQPVMAMRSHAKPRLRRAATSISIAAAIVVSSAGGVGQLYVAQEISAQADAKWEALNEPCSGALALATPDDCSPTTSPAAVVPVNPGDDVGKIFNDKCHTRPTQTDFKPCSWGDPNGDVRVALVGNSHGAVWLPALEAIALKHGWQLDSYNKAACSFNFAGRDEENPKVRDTCLTWVDEVIDHMDRQDPYDFIITSASAGNSAFIDSETGMISFEAGVIGYQQAWSTQTQRGTQMIVMRDYPKTTNEMINCSRDNPRAECSTLLEDVQTPLIDDVIAQATVGNDDAVLVDMTQWFCTDGVCPTVIGDVHVYRDFHHFTETYGTTLAKPLEQALREQTSMPL